VAPFGTGRFNPVSSSPASAKLLSLAQTTTNVRFGAVTAGSNFRQEMGLR